jgi:hypothetical protein
MNDPNHQARIKQVDWESEINDLLLYLREKTGVHTKLYVKPEQKT